MGLVLEDLKWVMYVWGNFMPLGERRIYLGRNRLRDYPYSCPMFFLFVLLLTVGTRIKLADETRITLVESFMSVVIQEHSGVALSFMLN